MAAPRITRRKLGAILVSVPAAAQTPAPIPDTAEEELKAAQDQVRHTSEILTKYPLPMATEPAFQFKAWG